MSGLFAFSAPDAALFSARLQMARAVGLWQTMMQTLETTTTTTTAFTSLAALDAAKKHLLASPRQRGILELIVARPWSEQRVCLKSAELTPRYGLHGDNWATHCSKRLPDGSSEPAVQITLMSTRMARLIAGEDRERWALAGDQLFVDFDLSWDNLPVGQRLRVGKAVLEITAELHKGCAKYRARFGEDALRFISTPEGRQMNLRGIYARVIEAGRVAVADSVEKI
jgi:hypothetical protein